MFWTISQFPELDHLDPEHRKYVLGKIPWWAYPLVFVLSGTCGLFAFVAAAIPSDLFIGGRGWTVLAPPVVVFVLVSVLAYVLIMINLRRVIRTELALYFRGRRPPFCFECGYNLEAFAGNVCPECGSYVEGRRKIP